MLRLPRIRFELPVPRVQRLELVLQGPSEPGLDISVCQWDITEFIAYDSAVENDLFPGAHRECNVQVWPGDDRGQQGCGEVSERFGVDMGHIERRGDVHPALVFCLNSDVPVALFRSLAEEGQAQPNRPIRSCCPEWIGGVLSDPFGQSGAVIVDRQAELGVCPIEADRYPFSPGLGRVLKNVEEME